MMTTLHPLAHAWLDRVEALAGDLDPVDRRELLADLREHLAQELGTGADHQHVRDVLARLGDPADIVAAASPEVAPNVVSSTPPVDGPRRLSGAEVTTLAGFVLSGLLLPIWPVAIVAWLLAAVLLATRDRWQGIENLVALLVPFGFATPWVVLSTFLVAGGPSCIGTEEVNDLGEVVTSQQVCSGGASAAVGPILWLGLAVALIAAVVGVAWLVRRLNRRLTMP